MRKPERWLAVMVLACASFLAGCGGGGEQQEDDLASRKIRIVSTVSLIHDAVLNIGGDRVEAISLMGPGIDPHLYKATEGDLRRLSRADVIFYNGLHLEAKMGEVLQRMERVKRTVPVGEVVPHEQLLSPAAFEGAFDPHIWFDVTLWMQAVARVRDTLGELDPGHRAIYEGNARFYLGELQRLHDYVLQKAASLPADRRILITAHDAFNYFGRAYGFQVRGLQGISTVSEAGTADVQDLVTFIAERKIPAIFVESSVPPRAIEAVQAAVRARGFDVIIGGELFSDAVGNPGSEAGTYVGMVRHNIDAIVAGLTR